MMLSDHHQAAEVYGLERISGPASEPVTLAEAKLHLRVDDDLTADDDLIRDLIAAAREFCEETLGRALVLQTWKLSLDYFHSWEIRLPRPPLSSVTEIKYVDSGSGVLTVLSPTLYDVDAASRPGRITPTWAGYWPAVRRHPNAVQITYTAGVADVTATPRCVKQAMLLLIGHWYVNREEVVTGTISSKVQQASEALLMTAWAGDY